MIEITKGLQSRDRLGRLTKVANRVVLDLVGFIDPSVKGVWKKSEKMFHFKGKRGQEVRVVYNKDGQMIRVEEFVGTEERAGVAHEKRKALVKTEKWRWYELEHRFLPRIVIYQDGKIGQGKVDGGATGLTRASSTISIDHRRVN